MIKDTQNVILDPESFGGSDFDDWEPISNFDLEVRELYNNPNVNGNNAWIQTYKGNKFFPQYPESSIIDIEDIAHALSNQCRFTGHTRVHYSVAQHCLLVSYLCQPEHALYGLLHDASEAYLTDIATPLKRLPELAGYREMEAKVQKTIFKRFELPDEEPADVKAADRLILGIEAQTFMSPLHLDWKSPIQPPPYLRIETETPEKVEEFFLDRFHDLTGYRYHYDQSKYQRKSTNS